MAQAINKVPEPAGGDARPTLDEDEQLARVKERVETIVERGVPRLIEAITKTDGTLASQITIVIKFKKGGPNSKATLETIGDLKMPLGGFTEEVAVLESEGQMKLRMFDD